MVITADALHTQRDHVEDLHERGAHWVLTAKGNQIRHEALCHIPTAGGTDSKGYVLGSHVSGHGK